METILWLLLKEGMVKMVKSYKELFEILKKDFDPRKVDFNRDLPKIFPQLKKRMTHSNLVFKVCFYVSAIAIVKNWFLWSN